MVKKVILSTPGCGLLTACACSSGLWMRPYVQSPRTNYWEVISPYQHYHKRINCINTTVSICITRNPHSHPILIFRSASRLHRKQPSTSPHALLLPDQLITPLNLPGSLSTRTTSDALLDIRIFRLTSGPSHYLWSTLGH